jgi:hypothetical protein
VFFQNKNVKSSPKAKSTKPAATATAEPPEDPPGIRSRATGFVGIPKLLLSPLILHFKITIQIHKHHEVHSI